MRRTISKMFDFDAAHHLTNVAAGHKCARPHGHTYRVEILVRGELDERGMVVDYADIARAWAPIHEMLDHRDLNTIEGLENPTTEILVPFIFGALLDALPDLHAVRVYESSTTWCEVSRADWDGEGQELRPVFVGNGEVEWKAES